MYITCHLIHLSVRRHIIYWWNYFKLRYIIARIALIHSTQTICWTGIMHDILVFYHYFKPCMLNQPCHNAPTTQFRETKMNYYVYYDIS